ncbi:MAG: aminomethyl-transferring glycine dehydrogenase [Bacteroidetes bacterium]|nr:aminomethyl-transferring glycine dehydrogenase [Bacteroidota bacterium]MDA0943419.1 aminomethyl-transferring glycine dehydrogenase [Bacteroidota bacterium]MDA1111722.1 aminomethyl-transferring glycine dehydrogenase [Bacteroidota bacterium]
MQYSARYSKPFAERHNGSHGEDLQAMLETVGVSSLDELISKTIPANIRLPKELNIGEALTESEFLAMLKGKAAKNKLFKHHIGMGYYDTLTPGVILRNIMENPGWYTAYTPYQAEIAQGRLEALLNYQTMVIDLSGMEIANASLLDEGTAAAEAMNMFRAADKKGVAHRFFVDQHTFPQTLDVLITRAEPVGVEIVTGDFATANLDDTYFGALIQYPNSNGSIEDVRAFVADCKTKGIKTVFASDLMALTLLTSPGDLGADCVVGNTQRFGVPMGFGGPHAAFFATKDEYKRQIPGRIIGVSIDKRGERALRMALQTREQHIKRQNATSNICTAQVLLSIMASMYGVYHGPDGLKKIAGRIHAQTRLLEQALTQLGYTQLNGHYFDTLKVAADEQAVRKVAEAQGRNLRYFGDGHVGISIDETCTEKDIQVLADIFAAAKNTSASAVYASGDSVAVNWPAWAQRQSNFMLHPVFNSYHIEHDMLRYIKSLEAKDLSLCHSMISLGSCTMKLNATTEMIPVTWPEFNSQHPFVPVDQVKGYLEMIEELNQDLSEITGFDRMSMQPNSGAQGEYAGLMVIREYFKDRGEAHRNIALIPSSAHGTNPASAVMAGMKVVVTACDELGNIDIADLRAKAEEHKDNLACLMVTYPSTHGVYEAGIREITQIIHDNGGQVYMDGANMNAQVGLTSPGMIGADVCHLNLHKTFCIPHGGGGPGMGPIGVAKHLTPYLPSHAVIPTGGDKAMHAVSAAPYGSASILLISYAYIKMMGGDGLKAATEIAILNANYMKARLEKEIPILYKGENGFCAHEMILDTRVFKQSCGIEAEDFAKRLMDYNFHAPTLSFPVAGTLMIEPTESESKAELDRFCDAMLSIREEIRAIENGQADAHDNLLKSAPHCADEVISSDWNHSFSREQAAFPLPYVKANKFWPTVSRVNNTHGDRNLVCACLPLEAYAEA